MRLQDKITNGSTDKRATGVNEKNVSISPAKKVAYIGILSALAIIMGYLEAIIPFNIGVPGIKLGICNIVILVALYRLGLSEALIVSMIRVIVIALLFGNIMSIMYSAAGALLSLGIMWLLKKTNLFGILGVSAAGGAVHGMAQVVVAYLLTNAFPVMWYMPILMIAGLFTGIIIGAVSYLIMTRIPKLREL